MYTSLKFSKKLKEAGCELESERYWYPIPRVIPNSGGKIETIGWEILIGKKARTFGVNVKVPAYDILNDICVKYAKEFFPEYKRNKGPEDGSEALSSNGILQITREILSMLQQSKPQEEIEKYIFENCLFNPKNK